MTILCIVMAILGPLTTYATDFDYPELQVVPLASERVKMEAIAEQSQGFYSDLPMQVSATATTAAALFAFSDYDKSKDQDGLSPIIGILVGGGWMAINAYHSMMYKPYTRTYNKIRKLKTLSAREKLLKERISEERIKRLARHGKRMKWMSFLTNSFASIHMLTNSKKDSNGQAFATLSILASLGPLIFDNNWEEVGKDHKENKKRIYRPILSAGLVPVGKNFAPGAMFSLNF